MHRYDVMKLAHLFQSNFDLESGDYWGGINPYAMKLAWQVYRVLKDENVSAAFWAGFSGRVSDYFDLLIWDAAREKQAGNIEIYTDYFERIEDGMSDEFWECVDGDMVRWESDTDWESDNWLSAYGAAYCAAMNERIYNALNPVNLFSTSSERWLYKVA